MIYKITYSSYFASYLYELNAGVFQPQVAPHIMLLPYIIVEVSYILRLFFFFVAASAGVVSAVSGEGSAGDVLEKLFRLIK